MKVLILLILFPVAVGFSRTEEPKAIHELKSAEMNLALTLNEIRSLYRDEPEFLAALSVSQQKWEEYRDAALTARFPKHDTLAEYGSVYPIAYATVRWRLIKQRVAELNLWLEGVGEGDVAAGSVKLKRELDGAKTQAAPSQDCNGETLQLNALMDREMIVCIPGPWADRSAFLRAVLTKEPIGGFMLAGAMLVDLEAKDHVVVEFCGRDSRIAGAFSAAGQGKLSDACLAEIDRHSSVVYLRFPLDLPAQRERVAKFTAVVRAIGGMAVKVESSGVAHTWERWEQLLTGSAFDLYCSAVVLVGDTDSFYSCGMHHFGLPECEVPSALGNTKAAELMNRFNAWQINDRPVIKSGEVFSVAADEPPFRLVLQPDTRHAREDLFHNPHGVWVLQAAEQGASAENKWKKPEGEPLFVAIPKNDEQMLAAYEKARATLPAFLKAITSSSFADATNSVKIKLRDSESGEDDFTYLWLWDVREEGDKLWATVRELPKAGLLELKIGEAVRISVADVHDWMIFRRSQAWGGFTLRVVRERMSPQERLQYAEYSGVLSFNDLPAEGAP